MSPIPQHPAVRRGIKRNLQARKAALGLLNDEPMPSEPPATPAVALTDRWGNAIIAGPGAQGQTVVRSAWDGRLISVCGQASNQNHVQFWDYSATERRYKCVRCFPRREGQEW